MSSSLHRNQYQVFRELLVSEREKSGMLQIQVAEKLGKPQSFVSKYERGERRLDFTEFVEIAGILNIPIDEFVAKYLEKLNRKIS